LGEGGGEASWFMVSIESTTEVAGNTRGQDEAEAEESVSLEVIKLAEREREGVKASSHEG